MNTLSRSQCAAVWIDHAKAVLVVYHEKDWELVHIFSYLDARHRSTGGKAKSKPYMHESGPYSAAHYERQQEHKRKEFFQQVIAALGAAKDLLILGSGQTSVQFHKALMDAHEQDGIRITRLRSKDLSPQQLKKKAREFFGWPSQRKIPVVPGQLKPVAIGSV